MQITLIILFRFIILQFLQIRFTEAITFIYSKKYQINLKIYFALNVMRARVRSYGVRSTVTLSPGNIRM